VARKRPAASDDVPPLLACLDGDRADGRGPLLTRAEARALLRSAPLTHADLRRHFAGDPERPRRSA
jgi:hypothetical protein